MSNILHKLTFGNAVILTAEEALSVLAVRGEWSVVAQRVAAYMSETRGFNFGEVLRFDSIGLAPTDFPTHKKTGEPNYSGITAAARSVGLLVKRTTDDRRAFYVPQNREEVIERVRAQRAKAAAKAKAKAAAKAKK